MTQVAAMLCRGLLAICLLLVRGEEYEQEEEEYEQEVEYSQPDVVITERAGGLLVVGTAGRALEVRWPAGRGGVCGAGAGTRRPHSDQCGPGDTEECHRHPVPGYGGP